MLCSVAVLVLPDLSSKRREKLKKRQGQTLYYPTDAPIYNS